MVPVPQQSRRSVGKPDGVVVPPQHPLVAAPQDPVGGQVVAFSQPKSKRKKLGGAACPKHRCEQMQMHGSSIRTHPVCCARGSGCSERAVVTARSQFEESKTRHASTSCRITAEAVLWRSRRWMAGCTHLWASTGSTAPRMSAMAADSVAGLFGYNLPKIRHQPRARLSQQDSRCTV